ncbi:MAG: hypothetical protein JWO91_1526 [Acidobacteriaceae bacterium]|nr:hypothetical protein [Acidobacteriaceae bacterium]
MSETKPLKKLVPVLSMRLNNSTPGDGLRFGVGRVILIFGKAKVVGKGPVVNVWSEPYKSLPKQLNTTRMW